MGFGGNCYPLSLGLLTCSAVRSGSAESRQPVLPELDVMAVTPYRSLMLGTLYTCIDPEEPWLRFWSPLS